MAHYFTKTVNCEIPGVAAGQHAAFTAGDVLFDWQGFEIPKGCQLLARGEVFKNQAFRYQNCYALQFHPEVNFFVHLRWIFLVLIKKPKVLFLKGSQNLFYQLYFRFKHNKSVSLWLDSFLDNYLLAQK